MFKVQTAEFLFLVQILCLESPILSSLFGQLLLDHANCMMCDELSLYLFPNCTCICHNIGCIKSNTFISEQNLSFCYVD